MTLTGVFIDSHGRLRSGWRFSIFFVLFFLFSTTSVVFTDLILGRLPIGYSPDSLLPIFVHNVIGLFWTVLLAWGCGALFERLPLKALGIWFTKNWLKDLVLGLVTGAIAIGFVVLTAVVFGGLSFRFDSDHGSSAILLTLAVSLVVFTVGAAFEEALCRGYILQTFVRSGLAWPAIVFTSLLFASGHLQNPSINPIALANTLLAGIWFGIAYMKTRTLWLPFGMHLMWNWVQGSIFGIEVSGITNISTAPLLLEIDKGPAWLTGAGYGIEGSISCTVVIIIAAVVTWFLPILRPTDEMLAISSPPAVTTEPSA